MEGTDDISFQFEVYASTRMEEMAFLGWDSAQQDAFLRMQFTMQQRSYAAQYPNVSYQIISCSGVQVGHVLVAREKERIRLVDLAVLPSHRNRGVGTTIIRQLQQEASTAEKPLKLHVMKSNRAIRLYERLGFRQIAENEMHVEMSFE